MCVCVCVGGGVVFNQLLHTYYFTTPILVLKFPNIGVFFEEIQDSHFPRKRGYFSTHLHEFGEKGFNVDVQCFTVKMGVHLAWKVSVLPQKRGFILDWKVSVLLRKRGRFELKSLFCFKKGGNFKLENKDGYHFFQWVRELGVFMVTFEVNNPDRKRSNRKRNEKRLHTPQKNKPTERNNMWNCKYTLYGNGIHILIW